MQHQTNCWAKLTIANPAHSASARTRMVCAILGSRDDLGSIRDFNSMRRSQLSIFALVITLFASVLGQALTSSSCPHMQQDHACCRARAARRSESRETACGATHAMPGGMDVTPAAESNTESSQSAKVFAAIKACGGASSETCDRCASRPPAPILPFVLSRVEVKNRVSELAPPVVAPRLSESYVTSVLSRDNSPPETSTARHVLVNVFRI
jgi:hypothetical protein